MRERAEEKIEDGFDSATNLSRLREPEGSSEMLNNPWGLGIRVRGFVDGVTLFSEDIGPVGLIRDDVQFTLFGITNSIWNNLFRQRVVAGIVKGLNSSDAEEKDGGVSGSAKLLEVEKARMGILSEWAKGTERAVMFKCRRRLRAPKAGAS